MCTYSRPPPPRVLLNVSELAYLFLDSAMKIILELVIELSIKEI